MMVLIVLFFLWLMIRPRYYSPFYVRPMHRPMYGPMFAPRPMHMHGPMMRGPHHMGGPGMGPRF